MFGQEPVIVAMRRWSLMVLPVMLCPKEIRQKPKKLWPLIEWCLEYCRRNLNKSGVVASDADELENRFPAGKANLCTSSLYYDALISAGYLGKDLGKPVAAYARQATALKKKYRPLFRRDRRRI